VIEREREREREREGKMKEAHKISGTYFLNIPM